MKSYKFVIHSHRTLRSKGRKHWDLRIDFPGVSGLRSFAMPKCKFPTGKESVLAIETEIHPKYFLNIEEKTIEQGNYGAGTMNVFDKGTCTIEFSPKNRNVMYITFNGKIIKGSYNFIKTKQNNWLIRVRKPKIKHAKLKKKSVNINVGLDRWKKRDPRWWRFASKNKEYVATVRQVRHMIHDFWNNAHKYSIKLEETGWEMKKPKLMGIGIAEWNRMKKLHLWNIKEDFMNPENAGGRLLLKLKFLMIKEAKLARKIGKEMGLPYHSKRMKIYRNLEEISTATIWRLLIMIAGDKPLLWSTYDKRSAGMEWELIWNNLGIR